MSGCPTLIHVRVHCRPLHPGVSASSEEHDGWFRGHYMFSYFWIATKKKYIKSLPKPKITGARNCRIVLSSFHRHFLLNFWDYLHSPILGLSKFCTQPFLLYLIGAIRKVIYKGHLNWKLQKLRSFWVLLNGRQQGCQHYGFFSRSTEFRKWSVFLQIFIASYKIFGFFTDFAIFWFFSPCFTCNWELSRLWSASIEVWACSFSGGVYNFVSVNLNFVIRMSKKFEKNKIPSI